MHTGIFKIDDKEYKIASSALTPLIYKHLFGKDILIDMQKVNSDTDEDKLEVNDTVTRLAFVMNRQTALDVPSLMRLSTDDFYIWLNNFDNGDFLDSEIITSVIDVWMDASKVTSKVKNPEGPQTEN